jgi:hypothetical protein
VATKRKLIIGAVTGGLLAAIVAAGMTLVTGFLRTPTMADQVTFPAQYTPSVPGNGLPGEDPTILLTAEGSGTAVNMPTGELRTGIDGACVESGGNLYTGDFTWHVESGGVIRIESSKGQALLLADPGKFGTWSWLDVIIPLCGEEPTHFGLRSPLADEEAR